MDLSGQGPGTSPCSASLLQILPHLLQCKGCFSPGDGVVYSFLRLVGTYWVFEGALKIIFVFPISRLLWLLAWLPLWMGFLKIFGEFYTHLNWHALLHSALLRKFPVLFHIHPILRENISVTFVSVVQLRILRHRIKSVSTYPILHALCWYGITKTRATARIFRPGG